MSQRQATKEQQQIIEATEGNIRRSEEHTSELQSPQFPYLYNVIDG